MDEKHVSLIDGGSRTSQDRLGKMEVAGRICRRRKGTKEWGSLVHKRTTTKIRALPKFLQVKEKKKGQKNRRVVLPQAT